MADQSALEQLLPELQRQILKYSDSPTTLYNFVRASPRIYQIFRANQEYTLSNIARRLFHDDAIHDALAIDRLNFTEDPPFSRENVLRFFEHDVVQQSESKNSLLPLSVSTYLCRLDTTVRFFIDDYSRHTLPILTHLEDATSELIQMRYTHDGNDSPPHLSSSELSRLRRAFCRFEIYRQLFARCSPTVDHKGKEIERCFQKRSITRFEQGQMFFQYTPAYRVAEIACVRDYLCRLLRGIFDLVEDEVVEALRAGCPHPASKKQAMEWDSDNGGRYGYFNDDECHLFTYLGKPNQEYHIEHLLSLGLPYIRDILKAVGQERENLLLRDHIHCGAQCERHFLTTALGLDVLTPHSEIYGWSNRNLESCMDHQDPSEKPPGWLWAHADGYYSGLVDPAWKGLRDWGYVFWDLQRLQEAGVLERDPREVRKVTFDEFQAAQKPSVQERWMGPYSFIEASETEDIEDIEDGGEEEEETGHGGQGEDEGEDRTEAVYEPLWILTKLKRWLRHAVSTVLKIANGLRRKGRHCITGTAANI